MNGSQVPIDEAATRDPRGEPSARSRACGCSPSPFAASRRDDELGAMAEDPMSLTGPRVRRDRRHHRPAAPRVEGGRAHRALGAGIDVRMITGDHAITAAAIGAKLGLGPGAASGADIQAMTDDELKAGSPQPARVRARHTARTSCASPGSCRRTATSSR